MAIQHYVILTENNQSASDDLLESAKKAELSCVVIPEGFDFRDKLVCDLYMKLLPGIPCIVAIDDETGEKINETISADNLSEFIEATEILYNQKRGDGP